MYKESKKRLVVTRESNNPIFSLSVCSEVLDGLRIYFDFTYKDLLLYKSEQGQIETAAAVYTSPMPPDTDESTRWVAASELALFYLFWPQQQKRIELHGLHHLPQ
jgi:hypothetical protein